MKKSIITLSMIFLPLMACSNNSDKSDNATNGKTLAYEKPQADQDVMACTKGENKKSCLEALANKNNVQAQYELGILYNHGETTKEDTQKAIEWYTKSAKLGYAPAQYDLGVMYYNGKGVKQDYKQALNWYTKSANQGYADAQNNLGIMYYNGKGVDIDNKKALHWLTLSANQGNYRAQYSIDAHFPSESK